MWRLIWFLQGYVQAELRGRARNGRWNGYQMRAWRFLRVQRIDDFTIALLILRKDVLKAEAAAQKAMCELTVVRRWALERRSAGSGDGGFCAGTGSLRGGGVVIPKFVFFTMLWKRNGPRRGNSARAAQPWRGLRNVWTRYPAAGA